MHNEVNIPSKKWKCSILHKRCPFFSAEQTVRRWRSDGGRPQSDLGWLRSLTNHQHPWLARNVLSGQRNIDFKIECMHYFYSLLCTPLGQCELIGQGMMFRILWARTLKVKGWIWLVTGRLVTQHISEYLTLHHCTEVWNWWIPPSSSVYETHYFPGKVQMVLSIPCIKVLYIEYSGWEFKRFFFHFTLIDLFECFLSFGFHWFPVKPDRWSTDSVGSSCRSSSRVAPVFSAATFC